MGDLCSRCPADRRITRGRPRWRSAVDTLISCGLPAVSRTTKIVIDGIVGCWSGPGLRHARARDLWRRPHDRQLARRPLRGSRAAPHARRRARLTHGVTRAVRLHDALARASDRDRFAWGVATVALVPSLQTRI